MKIALMLLLLTPHLHADEASRYKARLASIARAEYVTNWIYVNVEYQRSPNEVKDPLTTAVSRTGDCADMSGLLMYTLNREGIKARAVLMILPDYLDENGDPQRHMVVILYGIIFDPTKGKSYRSGEFPLRYVVIDDTDYKGLAANWGRK